MADKREELLEQARKTSAYFTSLIDLIPLKHYLKEDEPHYYSKKNIEECSGKTKREARKALAKKAKMLKLDPNKQKSVAELQKEIEIKEMEVQLEPIEEDMQGLKPIKVGEVPSLPLEDLKKKLHDKIEQLRGKRKLKDGTKEEKAKKRKVDKSARKAKQKKEAANPGILKSNIENERKVTQALNNDSKVDVVFSKLDFAEEATKKKKSKKQDIKTLLKKAEKRKANLEAFEEEDKEKANELKSKMKWDKAMKHAEGKKVKDDPKLLAKSLKRKQKLKETSKKKWEERVNSQKKQMDEKQKLRKQHIKERKEQKGVKGKKKKQITKGKKKKT